MPKVLLLLSGVKALSEKDAQGFFDLTHGMELDIVFVWVDALQIEGGDDDVGKAQLLGFGDALLDAAHRTNLTTQTYFASHTLQPL